MGASLNCHGEMPLPLEFGVYLPAYKGVLTPFTPLSSTEAVCFRMLAMTDKEFTKANYHWNKGNSWERVWLSYRRGAKVAPS